MKVPLISLLVAILLVGGATIVSIFLDDDYTSNNFTKKDVKIDTTNSKELQIRNGIIYFPDGVTPYTGRIQQFWDSGELYFEKNYNEGNETSACFWYKNGQKSEEKVYINGMIKFWKKWHENGQLFYEPIYKNGVKQSSKFWHKNGQLRTQSNFQNGVIQSSKSWSENGNISTEKIWKDGKRELYREWYSNEQLKMEYKNEWDGVKLPEGVEIKTHWRENGEISSIIKETNKAFRNRWGSLEYNKTREIFDKDSNEWIRQ